MNITNRHQHKELHSHYSTMLHQDNKTIILISGYTKSKKSSAARMLSTFIEADIVEMSAPVRRNMLSEDFCALLESLSTYRKSHGETALAKHVLQTIEQSNRDIIIVPGVRNASDYNEIICSKHAVITLFIHSSAVTRHARLDRDPTSLAKGPDDYSTLDSMACVEGIKKIAVNADYTIINEQGYPLTLQEQITKIVTDIGRRFTHIKTNLGGTMTKNGVHIEKLPVYDKNYDGPKDVISRVIKSKGELATLSTDSNINFLAYVEFPLDGKPRANHYHEEKNEYLYLIKGKVKLSVRKGGHPNDPIEEYIVEEGSLINMQPGYAHAYETLEPGFAVEFSPTKHEVIKRDKVRDYVIS